MGIVPEFADVESSLTNGNAGNDADASADGERIRRLARSAEVIHGLTYYSPEILTMTSDGFRGWWHTYFAYRPSPMGAVGPGVVTAAFYNFAPGFVARALPGVWSVMSPKQAHHRRLELVGAAIDRIFSDPGFAASFAETAALGKAAVGDLSPHGRPLFAAYADQPWPSELASNGSPESALGGPSGGVSSTAGLDIWHACTLLREFRGDNHNLVLAASGIDGCECHVFMAANGHGNQPTITGIRGWTADEWDTAVASLADRGYVNPDGSYTEAGRIVRSEIEAHTDALSLQPLRTLGSEQADKLISALELVAIYLVESGEVAGTWPPPATLK